MKAGFIGLGAMGQHMARHLAQAGQLAAVWSHTHAKAEAFCGENTTICAESPHELWNDCDIVFICVKADDEVKSVVEALAVPEAKGKLVVDCSTVSATTAREAAALLAGVGIHFLDAPITGGVEGAKNARLTFMVGGDAEQLARARPLFELMGQRVEHLGPVGAGQATKAVNQVLAAGINQAVCEALRFAESQRLPLDQVIDVIGSGAAGNWFINQRGKTMTRGVYAPGFKLALHHKDLNICLEMAAQAGVEIPLALLTRDSYARLMAEGHGDDDISGLYRLKKLTSR